MSRSHVNKGRQLDRERLIQELRILLKRWSNLPTDSSLAELSMVQIAVRREHESHEQSIRACILRSLKQLSEVSVVASEYAQILRLRFIDQRSLQAVATELDISIPTVSRRQNDAFESLADIVITGELRARIAQRDQFLARLSHPSYDKLFGFEPHIDNILHLLGSPSVPHVLSLEGIGGIGKTVLADQVMRRAIKQDMYADYAWITLQRQQLMRSGTLLQTQHESLQTHYDVLRSLANQLMGDSPFTGDDQLEVALKERLTQNPHLIVIDNLETLADVQSLLPVLQELSNPSLFLLTSRRFMEAELPIYSYQIQELNTSAALQLLRYEAASSGLPLIAAKSEQQLQPLINIVGGNPLALKLVIGQLHVHELGVVVQALLQARSQSIQNLYDFIYRHAWDNLDEVVQQVFLSLVLLPELGEDFAFLQATTGFEDYVLYQALNQLVVFNLVERHHNHSQADSWYRIHSLTRTFLTEQVLQWQNRN